MDRNRHAKHFARSCHNQRCGGRSNGCADGGGVCVGRISGNNNKIVGNSLQQPTQTVNGNDTVLLGGENII